MTALFSKPKMPPMPKPKPAPPPPERGDAETQRAAAEQRSRFFGSQGGLTSTLLTSGTGADEGTSAVVRLLGNSARV